MNDGGPAFPRAMSDRMAARTDEFITCEAQEGMTLRDYFAAKAMQSILISRDKSNTYSGEIMELISETAYQQADYMIAERSKKSGSLNEKS